MLPLHLSRTMTLFIIVIVTSGRFMTRTRLWYFTALALISATAATATVSAQTKGANEIPMRNARVGGMYHYGHYPEALPIALATLTLAERTLGNEHADNAQSD